MKHATLSTHTFPLVDAWYDSMLQGRGTYAIVSFSKEAQMLLPIHEAERVIELTRLAQPVRERSTSYRSNRFELPTLRTLTCYEHRCHWMADYFDVSLNEIEEYCTYDPVREVNIAHHLDFTPPDEEFLDTLDEDLRIKAQADEIDGE